MKNCFFNAVCLFSFGKPILYEIAKRRCMLKLLLAAVVLVCTVTFAFADYHNNGLKVDLVNNKFSESNWHYEFPLKAGQSLGLREDQI